MHVLHKGTFTGDIHRCEFQKYLILYTDSEGENCKSRNVTGTECGVAGSTFKEEFKAEQQSTLT